MPTCTEIKYGQDNDLSAAPTLSEEELDILKKRMAALDALLATEKKAKYKLELFFSADRHVRGSRQPHAGILSFWASGAKLHGGGDCKLYLCPGKTLGVSECIGIIPDSSQGYGYLVCPDCKTVWQGPQVHGEVLGCWTTAQWASTLYTYFRRFGHNADIYMKVPKHDIRSVTLLEQERQWKGEKLALARERLLVVYPLANLIKDTATGADILGRFRAFLSV